MQEIKVLSSVQELEEIQKNLDAKIFDIKKRCFEIKLVEMELFFKDVASNTIVLNMHTQTVFYPNVDVYIYYFDKFGKKIYKDFGIENIFNLGNDDKNFVNDVNSWEEIKKEFCGNLEYKNVDLHFCENELNNLYQQEADLIPSFKQLDLINILLLLKSKHLNDKINVFKCLDYNENINEILKINGENNRDFDYWMSCAQKNIKHYNPGIEIEFINNDKGREEFCKSFLTDQEYKNWKKIEFKLMLDESLPISQDNDKIKRKI